MKNIINWKIITLNLLKKKCKKCKKCNINFTKKELLYEQWTNKKSYFCPYCKNRIY